MSDIAAAVVSIADACLGGLQGRSALVLGRDEQCHPYAQLLRLAHMKSVFQEDSADRLQMLLPHVQLVVVTPTAQSPKQPGSALITAASVAQGCIGRRSPLLIFDLAPRPSVEELAGLLPPVCLYTPDDIRAILRTAQSKAS